MPQGTLKKKIKLPENIKQKVRHKDKSNMRKGHKTIVPRKVKLLHAARVRQGLEKQLKVSIENEAIQKANHSEPKPLEMFKSSSSQRVIQKTKLPKRK